MEISTEYYARWFLQYTGYFTHENLIEEKGKCEWFLPPKSHVVLPTKTHRIKGKMLVVSPPIS
jgi:hypothetical protein